MRPRADMRSATRTEALTPRVHARSPWWHGVLIVFFCMAVYNANLRAIGAYDSLAAGLIPFGIWQGDGIYLDKHAPSIPAELRYSMMQSKQGRWVSLYPIVTPLLVTPLYLPAAFWSRFSPADPQWGVPLRVGMEKLSGSLLTSLSVLLVYLAARRRAPDLVALGVAFAYAFATSSWAISSQALWQHGTGQFLLALGLYLLSEQPVAWRAALLGAVAGLITANRPHDIFFSVALAGMCFLLAGRRAWPFAVTAGTVAVILLVYNTALFPTMLGGYFEYRTPSGAALVPHWPEWQTVGALLFSNRGLLTFSPFLLLAFAPSTWASRPRAEWILLAAWFAQVLFYASFPGWSGGYTYGPRYLVDGLPVLAICMVSAVAAMRTPWSRVALALVVAFGVMLQAIGAFCYPAGDSGNEINGAWTITRSAPAIAWRHGPASPHFLSALWPAATMRKPLSPSEARYTLELLAEPSSWPAQQVRSVRVRLTNQGERAWSSLGGSFGLHGVGWLVRWRAAEAGPDLLIRNFWLAAKLAPGESNDRSLQVMAPAVPGSYVLTIVPAQFNGSSWIPFSAEAGRALALHPAIGPVAAE
jgi:hypothetical protein